MSLGWFENPRVSCFVSIIQVSAPTSSLSCCVIIIIITTIIVVTIIIILIIISTVLLLIILIIIIISWCLNDDQCKTIWDSFHNELKVTKQWKTNYQVLLVLNTKIYKLLQRPWCWCNWLNAILKSTSPHLQISWQFHK